MLLFSCSNLTNAQIGIDILEGPYYYMDCNSTCDTFHANFPKPLKTDQYSFLSIPYNPSTFSGTSLTLADDTFSSAIPLGFNFCFFNAVYSQCYLADNGVLSFSGLYNNAACNSNTQQTLPYFNSTFPDNAIFFMFMDVNPTLGGTIKYATLGTAPFRRFVADYQNMKIFGSTCSNNTSSYQVILYETTNEIEVQITNKVTCDANPNNYSNYATVGLQNIGASVAFTAPGKHASIFTAANEGIAIKPSGIPNYTVKWFNNAILLNTNVDSITFCPPYFPYSKLIAELTINCPFGIYTDTVVIDKHIPDIDSIIKVKPFCTGDSSGSITVYASGTNPPLTFSFNGGPYSSTNSWTGLPPGNYIVSVKNSLGCKKDSVVALLPLYSLNFVIDSLKKPTCPNNNGYITGHAVNGSPPYTIVWSNSDTGNVCDSFGVGTLVVTVTDSNGCYSVLPITIYYDSLPTLSSSITKPICGDSSGSILITVTSGHPPYQYLWSTGATTPGLQNIPSGLYTLTVTDSTGCTSTGYYFIADTLRTKTYKDSTHTTCGLNNGQAHVIPYGAVAPYTFSWQPSGQTSNPAINLPPGIHICTTADANGCLKVDTFHIDSSLAIINLISSANANCDSNNGKIFIVGVQNNIGFTTHLWSTGGGGTSRTGLAPGTYWVQTTDASGCVTVDTVVIGDDGKPHLGIVSYYPPPCYGDTTGSVTLTGFSGTAPYKYSLDGINFSSFAQINNISAGTYTIFLTDANSCLNDTVVTFLQPPPILVQANNDTVICFNDATAEININMNGGTPPLLHSLDGGNYINTLQYNGLTQGNYWLVVKDSNQCLDSTLVIVAGPPSPLEIISDIHDVPCFENYTGYIHLQLQGGWQGYQYQWSTNHSGLSLDSLDEFQTIFTVSDSLGCTLIENFEVKQELCCKAVVPNAFSPNGDTRNDVLKVLPISEVSSVKFSVFNRWGQLVFSTRDLNESWDGKYKGVDCEMDVYFYYLEYTCAFEKEKQVLKGDVTLLR